jgi:flagellar hook-associated protein 2
MSIAPLTFTGVSTYSNDLQSILSRAVQIANVPVTLLTNQQTDILQRKTLATSLSSAVSDLGNAVGALGDLGTSHALSATTSDSTKVTATATGATQAASYAITDITSVATAASESTLSGYATADATAVSKDGSLTLTLGSKTYSISLAAGKNNLLGLRDAINASGADVTATLLNTDSGSTPYYLSISAGATGANTLKLTDDQPAVTARTFATADATAVTASGVFKLTVGGVDHDITLGSGQNNLNGLRDAINGLSAGVTASVTGSGAAYQIALTPDVPDTAVTLAANPDDQRTALLTSANQGANTNFKFNGVSVSKPGTLINDLIPGLIFNINGTTTDSTAVNIRLAPDRTQVSSALNTLVSAYNAVATQVNAQIGKNAGLLTGNSMIQDARAAMTRITAYNAESGSVKNLSELGISMSTAGVMSFDTAKLTGLSDTQMSDAFTLLGSATSGLGALKQNFTEISDPYTGTIQTQIAGFDAADKRITDRVADMTTRINAMQTALSSKLQVADSLLASLASEKNMLTANVDSLNFTTYGYTKSA